MKIRLHRGGLADSLATMREIQPTIEAVLAYVREDFPRPDFPLSTEDLSFRHVGFDERIGWETYYVVSRADHWSGVLAMTDGLPVA